MKARIAAAGVRGIWAFDNRWELILRRLFFRHTGILTYRKGAMEIVVDHFGGDETGTRECLTSDMYRKLLPKLDLTGPLTLFDIGANGGGFPLMLLDMGYRIARIGAVEMNPRTFGRMQLNVLQNVDAATCLMNAAICGAPTTLEVAMSRGSTGESIAGTRNASAQGAPRIARLEGLTFDQAFDRAFGADGVVDLVKIDIEGSEYGIFAGDAFTRLAQCRYLLIEIHDVPGQDPETVADRIRALGFAELPGSRKSHDDVWCFVNRAMSD